MNGTIRKLTHTHESPIQYYLPIDKDKIHLNPHVGKKISLEYTGNIFCLECGNKTNKSFNQGYCFPCTQRLASCDMCILRPETCHYHQGTCREPQWGEENCFIPHTIYLANSSGLKVGITRTPVQRWIDQGAVQAIPILKVANRFESGKVEVFFKQFVADKTNWRKMLKNEVEILDLKAERDRMMENWDGSLDAEILDEDAYSFDYPVLEYPEKIKSLNFDKTPLVEGTLMGIKGQYLLFDTGVINIRKFAGYECKWSI